jgi:hypothetical protein
MVRVQVLCPQCANAIPGADFDLARGIAVCRPCGEIVPLPSFASTALAIASPAHAPPKLYKPAGFRFIEIADGDRYEASVPPNRVRALPGVFFCLFWDAFMIVWYGIAFTKGIWPMALFGLLHLGAGIFMTHRTLVALFNTRRVRIADGVIAWKSGPIPTRGNFEVPLDGIDGFVAREKTSSKSTTTFVGANLANGTMRELDVTDGDAPGAEYAAESFNDALARARQKADASAYRG